jgi:hypothetical protein
MSFSPFSLSVFVAIKVNEELFIEINPSTVKLKWNKTSKRKSGKELTRLTSRKNNRKLISSFIFLALNFHAFSFPIEN